MLKSFVTRRSSLQALVVAGLAALLAACGGGRKIVTEDFAEGRVVDLSITEKLTGSQELLFVSLPKKTKFLEGYIQGVITDYSDNPVQGVVVRAVPAGETQLDDEGGGRSTSFAVSSFDPGVSDTNGFYRIRFTLPILSGLVDVRGKLLYNPGWEQERETLGKAYEPQLKQSQFRLYYEHGRGRITFTEGIRKTIVAPVLGHGAKTAAALPGAKPGGAEMGGDKPAEAGGKGSGGDDDLFKGFGFQ
jgi:hypothetical protein